MLRTKLDANDCVHYTLKYETRIAEFLQTLQQARQTGGVERSLKFPRGFANRISLVVKN
jgi:hypothetical protein